MTSTSLCSATTLRVSSACSSSGLTTSLPSLSCPDPALADTLAPDPLSLCNGHHPGAAPAVAPHPDVHLVKPDAVALVPLRVGRGASKTPIVLEVVWNSAVTVAADETRELKRWGGCSPACSLQGIRHCRGRARAGCWLSHRAWALQPAAWCCLETDQWAQMCIEWFHQVWIIG